MGEVVNVLVAFAVIVFIFRWVTSDNSNPNERSAADTLGFRPKDVTQDMINTISHMFPDIPVDNIRYDLLRTGSVESTSNKILERGYLDAPPAAYYTLYPRQVNTNNTSATAAARSSGSKSNESLITRYNLLSRVDKEKVDPEEIGGKATWEDTPEKREASLRERKAKMILAARQCVSLTPIRDETLTCNRRMLEQQQKEASNATA
ncbi:hypothetical protein BDQ17DRAFT_1240840 [Cyathus striatus]|nr:hypothetical protein BDQ17DRAFT_1240840 [Cyathus striatus]